ncbi:MAG: transporter [Saprospiraceae bacterium]|nr:transporter [Saprospiraceae bacterium]
MERRFFKRKSLQQESKELGFGATDARQKRLLNTDGTYNYKRKGLPFYRTFNIFHFLITAHWIRLWIVIILWYSLVNFVFVGLYYAVGTEGLSGMVYQTQLEKFGEVYFFSAQTLTTVGYGRLNPIGFWASAIASFEALVGLMSFAIITGILYARFAKAPTVLIFSKNAVVAPFTWQGQEVTGLMFRIANAYNTSLMNMKAQITASILDCDTLDASGQPIRRFLSLGLERETITFFPSSWTVVHPIDENSPFYGMTREDFKKAMPELMILMSGFDETFDQNVFIRYSYSIDEIEWGAKFVKIFAFDTEGQATVDLGSLDTFEKREIDSLIPISDA